VFGFLHIVERKLARFDQMSHHWLCSAPEYRKQIID
jgi:hypothetical protein